MELELSVRGVWLKRYSKLQKGMKHHSIEMGMLQYLVGLMELAGTTEGPSRRPSSPSTAREVEALFFFPFVSFRVRVGGFWQGSAPSRLDYGGGWGREGRRSGTDGGEEAAPLGELPRPRMAARCPLGRGSCARTGKPGGSRGRRWALVDCVKAWWRT